MDDEDRAPFVRHYRKLQRLCVCGHPFREHRKSRALNCHLCGCKKFVLKVLPMTGEASDFTQRDFELILNHKSTKENNDGNN